MTTRERDMPKTVRSASTGHETGFLTSYGELGRDSDSGSPHAFVWPEKWPEPLMRINRPARMGVVLVPDYVVLRLASAVYPKPSADIRVSKPIALNGMPYVVTAAIEGRVLWFDRVTVRPILLSPPGTKILLAGRPYRAPIYAFMRPESLEIVSL